VRPWTVWSRLLCVLLVLCWNPPALFADGWNVRLLGVKSIGAGLGGRAAIEDASAVWLNPAGMTQLDQSWSVTSGVPIIASGLNFTDHGSFSILGQPLVGTSSSDGGLVNVVPHLYVAHRVASRLWIGGGINSTAGLSNDYGNTWVGRYHATASKLTVVNMRAAGGIKISDGFSIGVGLDVQRSTATLENQLDLGSVGAAVGFPLAPQAHDGHLTLDASTWAVGYDLSLIAGLARRVRGALTYRSQIDHSLEGTATFDLPPETAGLAATGAFRTTGASATFPMPQEVAAAIAVDLNDRWTVLGDLIWTDWSHYQQLVIDFDNPAQPAIVQAGNYTDTARVSFGVVYHANDKWTFRGGAFYDESPVPESTRTPRLPEADNLVFTAGGTYRFGRVWDFDFGWSHLVPHDASLRNADVTAGLLVGNVRSESDVFAFGVSVGF
jgi:long-chain fatty acid transport protein